MARSTLPNRTRAQFAPGRTFPARKIGVILTAVAVVGTLLAIAVVAAGSKDALARLRVRSATVEIDHSSSGFVPASDGQDVAEGDVVQTSQNGQAIVDYFEGSVTRLDGASRLVVRQLRSGSTGHHLGLELMTGRIWSRVKELTSSSDRFELKLPHATVSVRGTSFFADCRSADGCYVVGVDGTSHLETDNENTDVQSGDCELVNPDGRLTQCDADKRHLIDRWVRENLAEDQQLVTTPVAATPTPTETPSDNSGASNNFVPGPAPKPTIRAPSKTPPPSTPGPTKDHNNDGVFTTPAPPPKHTPHGSPHV